MTFLPQTDTPHADIYDVCVIGGGINGTGIARDAAGRGLKVLLVEQGDLAQATSSASTKIIHGGLRYLEYYDFRLVHESLHERDLLLRLAPHLIRPLSFVLPHDNAIRPYWLVRAGLYLYDLLGAGKTLPKSRGLDLSHHPAGAALQPHLQRGFSYSDCWGDDARLVALNAAGARDKGALIETRTRCTGLSAMQGVWTVTLENQINHAVTTIRSQMVVNAAGPWVRNLIDGNDLAEEDTPDIRLVQGSHIIVPKLYDGDHAYMLQQPDGRIIFAIPYEGHFTQLGTTEMAYTGDPLKAGITAQELDYLITASNRAFRKQITLSDIVRSFCGVRPLFDDHSRDAKAVTRDYRLYSSQHDGAKLLSVFGGKITTYRKLAEHAVDSITEQMGRASTPWTHREALPGGDWNYGLAELAREYQSRWPQRDPAQIERYARSYGTQTLALLQAAPGTDYGDGVCEAELRYLIAHEFALTAEDVLWRRSKLGLHVSAPTQAAIRAAMPAFVKEMTGHDVTNLTGN